jgi:hypothetical protein
MKNLLILIALYFGLGLYTVQAGIDPDAVTNAQYDATYNNPDAPPPAEADDDDPDKTPADRNADREDKSKVGNALDKSGSAIESGAKWTWDKAKHNKLTKNVFNQPDDK